jgi:hypothetical protein
VNFVRVMAIMRFRLSLLFLVLALTASAQDTGPDSSRFDVTLSYWPVHTTGTIRASGTPVDFQSDLGVNQNAATFTGKLDFKLGHRSRVNIEGTPFRLDGSNNLARAITYQSRTFTINDRITSTADLDYFYAGYQFDLIAKPSGNLGLEAGGAYLNASGAITSQTTGITASRSETIGMPLAGVAFRAFPIHRLLNFEINGEVKGMAFGDYGHYLQAEANIGVGRGHVFVEGGYRIVNADIHTTIGANGVTPEFRGPVVSLLLRL